MANQLEWQIIIYYGIFKIICSGFFKAILRYKDIAERGCVWHIVNAKQVNVKLVHSW